MPATGTITQYNRGLAVTLEQFEAAMSFLGTYLGETDQDGLTALIKRAKLALTTSVHPAWNHNGFMSPMSHLLKEVRILACLVSPADAPDMYSLEIRWLSSIGKPKLEELIAEELGLSRILRSVNVSFPLEVVHGGTWYRYDLEPYIGGLARLGLGPFEANASPVTVAEAIKIFETQTGAAMKRHYPVNSAQWRIRAQYHQGLEVSLATYGTVYTRCNGIDPHVVMFRRTGSVFTGPIAEFIPGEPALDKPAMVVDIQRPAPTDGDAVWPVMYSDALKAPMLQLAAKVSNMLTR